MSVYTTVSAEDLAGRFERRTDLTRAMENLKPRERAMLWLAYAEGSSHREIADALGVKPRSVKLSLGKRSAWALPRALILLLLLHEGVLWALAGSDVPNVLFAPGAHSPVLDLTLIVSFVILRLVAYFVVPFAAVAWLALKALDLLSAAVARRASADASNSRATQS